MNSILLSSLALLIFSISTTGACQFGNAPQHAESKALCERIAATHKSQGIEKAIALLEGEGRAYIKKSSATARFDFFGALIQEAAAGRGRSNHEWCLALTEWCYLYCRDVGEDYWSSKFTPEMHNCYFRAGRYGAARAVIEYDRIRQAEDWEDIDIAKFPTVGVFDPAFPALAKRTFGKMERMPMKQFSIFVAQAEQDLAEGKWRHGMEAAALGYSHAMGTYKWHETRPNLTDSKSLMTSTTGYWRMMRAVMIQGYRFLDLPELELKECRELAAFNIEEGREIYDLQMAKARSRHLKCVLGQQHPKALEEMDEIRKVFLTPEYNALDDADRVHLMMADLYFMNGKAQSGWDIINGIRKNKDLSRDMKYEVDMEWCRHRVDTGEYDTVEDALVALLQIAREGGLKQREIGLYEIYARLLISLERFDDAMVIQNELIRLLKSFDVFTRLPKALQQRARIQALIGQPQQAKETLTEAIILTEKMQVPAEVKVRLRSLLNTALPNAVDKFIANNDTTDLQPQRSISVPLAGLSARGLLTLTNFSGNAVHGQLSLIGKGLMLQKSNDNTVVVEVDVPNGKNQLLAELTLAAGAFHIIDLSRSAQAGQQDSKVAIEWKPTKGKVQKVEWNAGKEEEDVTLAITDAAEYVDNAFYMIPIYHLLQYKDHFARATDMRVISSQPARVELYDDQDRLVFVDANGDGAFTSEGDIISQDMNRNSMADMTIAKESKEMRFRLFVRPLKIQAGSEVTLDIQLFQAGKWVTNSQDKIIFPMRN